MSADPEWFKWNAEKEGRNRYNASRFSESVQAMKSAPLVEKGKNGRVPIMQFSNGDYARLVPLLAAADLDVRCRSEKHVGDGLGIYQPRIRVWRKGSSRVTSTPMVIFLDEVHVCLGCAFDLTLNQVLSQDGRRQIEERATRDTGITSKKKRLDWSRAELAWPFRRDVAEIAYKNLGLESAHRVVHETRDIRIDLDL